MALRCVITKLYHHFPTKVRHNSTFKGGIRNVFGKYLIYTNTISSGILMAFGDLIQQEIEYQNDILPHRYEWDRVGRMSVIGFIQGAPQHWFYLFLDKILPGSSVSIVLKKIFIDQLCASPFCICLFFTGMGLMEGKDLSGCISELRQKFFTCYAMDCSVWPPAQFVNFYFLPGKYRVIYINGVTMLYNIFLSYIKHVDHHRDLSKVQNEK